MKVKEELATVSATEGSVASDVENVKCEDTKAKSKRDASIELIQIV